MSTYLGIDVSKATLACACYEPISEAEFANDETGIAATVKWIVAHRPRQVVLEATGGYETPVLMALAQAGVRVCRVNARQARQFAKAMGRTAKTDAIDARVLAHLSSVREFVAFEIPNAEHAQLDALTRRRTQIQSTLTAERNRLSRNVSRLIQRSVVRTIGFLKKELALIDRLLKDLLTDEASLAQNYKLLRSLGGFRVINSAGLLAALPELGHRSGKSLAALSGLAPMNNDSGTHRGKRRIHDGRARARQPLYMATLTLTRHNTLFKAFYQRLLQKGKPKKVALVACMRKLLTIINAMIRDQTPWNPNRDPLPS